MPWQQGKDCGACGFAGKSDLLRPTPNFPRSAISGGSQGWAGPRCKVPCDPGLCGRRARSAKSYVDSALELPEMPGDSVPARYTTPEATRAGARSSVSSPSVAPLVTDPLKR